MSQSFRENICYHLQECGFAVIAAENADVAVALLLKRPEIDLVFTDVRMVGTMDGSDLARWVQNNKAHIPVLIASGDLGRAAAMKDLCGVEAFMKPYDHDQVVDRMRIALAKKSPREDRAS